jgi:hypothetical protein
LTRASGLARLGVAGAAGAVAGLLAGIRAVKVYDWRTASREVIAW